MRVNEFVSEGIADSIRGSMYRNLGIGGVEGNEIAAKNNFVNRFKQQIKLNQKAGQKAGGFSSADLQQMVDSYLSQYGWVANSQDRVAISKFIEAGDMDALANQMYLVGSKQMRDPKTGASIDPSKLGGNQTGSGAAPDAPQLSSTTQSIVSQLSKMTGKESLDDLEQITKQAMQRLYKMSPARYQKLYKEIMTGQSSKPTMTVPAKGSPEDFAARRSLAAQKAQSMMVPK
jgi:hypothetical protein